MTRIRINAGSKREDIPVVIDSLGEIARRIEATEAAREAGEIPRFADYVGLMTPHSGGGLEQAERFRDALRDLVSNVARDKGVVVLSHTGTVYDGAYTLDPVAHPSDGREVGSRRMEIVVLKTRNPTQNSLKHAFAYRDFTIRDVMQPSRRYLRLFHTSA